MKSFLASAILLLSAVALLVSGAIVARGADLHAAAVLATSHR
jgi:hypothetical protein